jgi:hypothetical protein
MIDQRALDIAVRRHPYGISWVQFGHKSLTKWLLRSIIAEYHRVVRELAR